MLVLVFIFKRKNMRAPGDHMVSEKNRLIKYPYRPIWCGYFENDTVDLYFFFLVVSMICTDLPALFYFFSQTRLNRALSGFWYLPDLGYEVVSVL
jgi:hypothetical protein